MLIGLISDTHGYMDPRVPPTLVGAERILHAGDVGSQAVLDALAEIAPVTAVCGNNDEPLGCLGLPQRFDTEIEGVRLHLVHRLTDATPLSATRGVVYGHSHKAQIAERDGVLYVNPGAAGRVGFHREITVARLRIEDGRCQAELVIVGPRLPSDRRRKSVVRR
jgi:putative phosphoesterase